MVWLWAFRWLPLIGMAVGTLPEFPNPRKEHRLCGRKDPSFVCDPEFVLDIGDADRLDRMAEEFRRSTTCLCSSCESGISIGIFVKRNLTQESLKQYRNGKTIAEVIRKRWHLGNCNDDVVILLLTSMNITAYSMGLAVSEIFPMETADLIMKECKTHFLSEWYYQGLESVVNSFNDVLIKLQKREKIVSKNLIVGVSLGIGVLFILGIFAIALVKRQRRRRKQGCQDIYESISTDDISDRNSNKKISEYHLNKLNTENVSDDEEEEEQDDENCTDENVNLNVSYGYFSNKRRHLSDVPEESSEDNETLKNASFSTLTNSQLSKNNSLQVTEL